MNLNSFSRRDLLKSSLATLLAAEGTRLTSGLIPSPEPGATTPLVANKAIPADRFIDSIGVNTHVGYGRYFKNWTAGTGLRDKLLSLGVRHIRDSMYNQAEGGPWQASYSSAHHVRMRDLADRGINFTLGANASTDNSPAGLLRAQEWNGGAIVAFEGPNEPTADMAAQCREVLATVRSSLSAAPSLSAISLIGWSLVDHLRLWNNFVSGDITAARTTWIYDPGADVDYGNWHPYPGGLAPEAVPLHVSTTTGVFPHAKMFGACWQGVDYGRGRGMLVSESGYHNAMRADVDGHPDPHRAISELGAAKYIGRMFAEYFRLGYVRTFSYEFADHPVSDPTDKEQHFGLVRGDGSLKPAYRTVRNLISLMADPGPSFSPGSLHYAVSGGDSDLRHMLFQKRDGSFWLMLWSAKSVWDRDAQVNLSPPPQNATLTFGSWVKSATSYTPREGARGARLSLSGDMRLTVAVPSEVVLLRIIV